MEDEERKIQISLSKNEVKRLLQWGFFNLSKEDQELWRKLDETLVLPT